MTSKTTPQFWQHYASLPAEIRQRAAKAHVVWKDDPGHGSLHFKKLAGHDALWSVRIGRQYRALARRKGDLVVWVWIGLIRNTTAWWDEKIGEMMRCLFTLSPSTRRSVR